MSNEEQRYARSCEILANIVDRPPTTEEMLDLTSLLGLKVEDWYYQKETEVLEVIELERIAA